MLVIEFGVGPGLKMGLWSGPIDGVDWIGTDVEVNPWPRVGVDISPITNLGPELTLASTQKSKETLKDDKHITCLLE